MTTKSKMTISENNKLKKLLAEQKSDPDEAGEWQTNVFSSNLTFGGED